MCELAGEPELGDSAAMLIVVRGVVSYMESTQGEFWVLDEEARSTPAYLGRPNWSRTFVSDCPRSPNRYKLCACGECGEAVAVGGRDLRNLCFWSPIAPVEPVEARGLT